MHYCGLDVSRKSTHVYIEDAQGRRVTRGIVATTPTGLAGAVERYTARGVRVAIEAGNQTAWIVDLLRELGAKVHVVHPLKVKLIAESKKKTDRIDAQLLAHLLRIGGLPEPVHVPSHRSRELRGLLVARRQLVHMRTRLVNVVRGLARQQRIELRPRALRTHGGGASWRRRSCRPRCERWWPRTRRPCRRWARRSAPWTDSWPNGRGGIRGSRAWRRCPAWGRSARRPWWRPWIPSTGSRPPRNWWPTRGWRRVCGPAGSGWNTDGSRNRGGARFARSGFRPRTQPSPSGGRRPPPSSAGGHGWPGGGARRRPWSPWLASC